MINYRWLSWGFGVFFVFQLLVPLPSPAKEAGENFSREELTQMLAPVALYPDILLTQVLMAATYPLEVVAADRWVKNNPLLKGDNLDEALRDKDWDDSVKSLCQLPALLGLMSERLEETTHLGDAFLGQEKEVMDTIQDLRARARREGNLQSDDQQRVTVDEDGTIIIESVDPETVRVPYYNSRFVYGPWGYPAWPPWYWGPDELILGSGIYFWPDFYFGFGFGSWSRFDWSDRTIVIDGHRRPHFSRPDDTRDNRSGSWSHAPSHRRGVVYRDRQTAERFGQSTARIEQADQQASRSRVRGPMTAAGVNIDTSEGADKLGQKGVPSQKSATAPPNNASDRRRGGVTAAPVTGASPRVQPTSPAQEIHNRDNDGGQVAPRSRVISTDEDDPGSGPGRNFDRRGDTGGEGRQWRTPDRRGGGQDDSGGGFGRNGRH